MQSYSALSRRQVIHGGLTDEFQVITTQVFKPILVVVSVCVDDTVLISASVWGHGRLSLKGQSTPKILAGVLFVQLHCFGVSCQDVCLMSHGLRKHTHLKNDQQCLFLGRAPKVACIH